MYVAVPAVLQEVNRRPRAWFEGATAATFPLAVGRISTNIRLGTTASVWYALAVHAGARARCSLRPSCALMETRSCWPACRLARGRRNLSDHPGVS